MKDKGKRLAGAAANIMRGAVRGGLHGAAIAAAQSFAPEIIKIIAIALCLLLSLPLIVYSAIPNIFFGYDNSAADDIISLTDQAYHVSDIYSSLSTAEQNYIEEMIDRIKSEYRDDYDSVEITEDTGHTNLLWAVAICSVKHEQDLWSMDKESIFSIFSKKFKFNITFGSGETDARKLLIEINETSPEELMEKLEFTEEQKHWAALLYSTISEDQNTDYDYTDGDGYYGTNYGNVTFPGTASDISVVYYNQTDERWGGIPYGNGSPIAVAGCGPTSLAMVAATLTENKITPVEAANWSVANGHRASSGSYHSLIPKGGEHYGLKVTAIGRNGQKLVDALSEGKLAIAIMGPGHFTKGGHFIVLRGITNEGKILVADSASYARSQQEWKLSVIVNEARSSAGAGGPFWIFE